MNDFISLLLHPDGRRPARARLVAAHGGVWPPGRPQHEAEAEEDRKLTSSHPGVMCINNVVQTFPPAKEGSEGK